MKEIRRRVVKDVLEVMLVAISLLLLMGMSILLKSAIESDGSNEYYRSAVVTDIKGNIAYLEDTTGNIWTVENENVQMYGRYILTMNDNNTDTIYDDEIIKIEWKLYLFLLFAASTKNVVISY